MIIQISATILFTLFANCEANDNKTREMWDPLWETNAKSLNRVYINIKSNKKENHKSFESKCIRSQKERKRTLKQKALKLVKFGIFLAFILLLILRKCFEFGLNLLKRIAICNWPHAKSQLNTPFLRISFACTDAFTFSFLFKRKHHIITHTAFDRVVYDVLWWQSYQNWLIKFLARFDFSSNV